MKSIRRRRSKKLKSAIFGALAVIILAAISYANIINPLFSRAATAYMTATIIDDNGEIDFSPGIDDAVANFSFTKSGSYGASSKIYDVKISLRDMPSDVDKKLQITLPVGMYWQDDGANDANLSSQLDVSRGKNGIESAPVDAQPVLGYEYPNSGSRVYYFAPGSVALVVNLKVKVDSVIDIGYIEDAIKADFYTNDTITETARIDVNVPDGLSKGGRFYTASRKLYVKSGETYQTNDGYYRLIRSGHVIGQYDVKRLIKNTTFNFHVSDPAVKIALLNPGSTWSIDDSGAANGDYVITNTFTSASNGSITVPCAYVIPEEAEDGAIYTIKATAETTYYEPDGTERTLNFSNAQTITLEVLPNKGLVTIGWADLNPANSATAHDVGFSATSSSEPYAQGSLGVFRINNKGSSDSEALRARLSFDTDVLGVMAVEIGCGPGTTIEKLYVKTKSGVEKDVDYNKTCNQYGFATSITYAEMGLERFDYIKEIEYDFGVIPAGHQISQGAHDTHGFAYVGRFLGSAGDTGVATMELFEKDHPENTTGVAKVTTGYTSNAGTLDLTNHATRVINAGNALNFKIKVSNWAGTTKYNNTVAAPIVYIRQEAKDASGDFLPISNLKITNDTARGNEDITSYFGQITYEDTADARVYKLDATSVPDGKASLCAVYIGENGVWYDNVGINISWSVNTDITTPDQHYNIANMVFVTDPNRTGNITTHYNRGDPFNITGTPHNTVYAATTSYYQIRGWMSIGVENSGKHTASEQWLTWEDGANPITIGTADGSLADMKATMINNSGVEVEGPTVIYFPIPKKGENWGSLNHDNKAFEFSTALTDAITNPDKDHFTIEYGKNITPTDDGLNLQSESSKFSSDTSGWTSDDWGEVNCIKITAMDIPANQPGTADNYDFIYKLKVVDSTNASDGAVNTWRPIYYQQLTNSAGDVFAGWYKGSYVSVKLAEGKVSGQIFIDSNENGKKDSNEQDLKEAGWKIDLYDKVSNRLVRSTMSDANGKYNFIELAMSADGYYINVTNKHPIGDTETAYLFTKKGATSNTGAYNTDNQAEGSISGNPIHGSAYVGPVSPNNTAGEATYNIGVVEYVATNSYSGQVSFSDQNNRFSTRPATVNITATDSDGKTTIISVATDGDGKWTKDLPNYNDRGQKLQYEFSAPDLNNYDMSDRRVSDSEYNVRYIQKTATLTVNHYKKGTTEELAQAESSTVYWGQTYTTTMAEVDSNYEFDSVNGKESDVVSGDVTVTYYYKLKTGTITTHYYIKDTNASIAPDVVQTKNYTETYTTSPLETIPAAYQNYELVSEHPEGYTGTVSKPSVEVVYYYQKKDPNLSSNISIKAPENVDNKTAKISYEINYGATVKDYIGSISISIIDKLPYPILVDESELDGGVYDAKNQTITWTVNKNHNTYTDGEEITITHNVSLIYDGAKATDSLANIVEATITLENKDNSAADSAVTTVKTPSKIIYHFVGPDGEEIEREIEDTGFVGDISDITPPEIPGYRLITNVDTVLRFDEEEQVILYRYEKLPEPVSPATGDNIAGYFAVFGTLATILGLVWNRRRHTR